MNYAFGVAAVLSMCAFASPAAASTITFNLSTQFVSTNPVNNTPVSTSVAPFGTLTFTDVAPVAGSPRVAVTIQASLETPTEFFRTLVFNGAYNSFVLGFSQSAKTGSFTDPSGVGTGVNNAGLNPPTGFDYMVQFPEVDAAQRFDGTDSITYTISCNAGFSGTCGAGGTNPLDATDFNFANTFANPPAGYTGWYALVWLGYDGVPNQVPTQGARYGDNTGGDNFGTTAVATPEPASLLLLGAGLAGVARVRRRRPV